MVHLVSVVSSAVDLLSVAFFWYVHVSRSHRLTLSAGKFCCSSWKCRFFPCVDRLPLVIFDSTLLLLFLGLLTHIILFLHSFSHAHVACYVFCVVVVWRRAVKFQRMKVWIICSVDLPLQKRPYQSSLIFAIYAGVVLVVM